MQTRNVKIALILQENCAKIACCGKNSADSQICQNCANIVLRNVAIFWWDYPVSCLTNGSLCWYIPSLLSRNDCVRNTDNKLVACTYHRYLYCLWQKILCWTPNLWISHQSPPRFSSSYYTPFSLDLLSCSRPSHWHKTLNTSYNPIASIKSVGIFNIRLVRYIKYNWLYTVAYTSIVKTMKTVSSASKEDRLSIIFYIWLSVRTKRYRIVKCDAKWLPLRLKMPDVSHLSAIQKNISCLTKTLNITVDGNGLKLQSSIRPF